MMRYFYVLITAIFTLQNLTAINRNDSFFIEIRLKEIAEQPLFLTSLSGETLTLVDSGFADSSGIKFSMQTGNPAGVYRVLFVHPEKLNERTRKIPYLEFIWNNENIVIETDVNHLNDIPKIIQSEENRVYYNFLTNTARLERKIQILTMVLNEYPNNEKFYQQAHKEFNQVRTDYFAYLDKMIIDFSGTYASRLMRMKHIPIPDPTLTSVDANQYMKAHYFDNLTFSDPLLMNSNAYTNAVIDYLSLYRTETENQAEQERLFIEAVDVIFANVNDNPEVFNFILEYLLKGFRRFGMDKVIDHIAANYQAKECESGQPEVIQKRLDAFRKMTIGNVVPNFVVETHVGRTISLYSFDNEYKIIVFWATWCPHCMQIIPQLDTWYKAKSDELDAELIAVSVDTNAVPWLDVIENYQLEWHNYCSLTGWEDEVLKSYNVYATPTIFILNRRNEIVAKPVEYDEFEAFFIKKAME